MLTPSQTVTSTSQIFRRACLGYLAALLIVLLLDGLWLGLVAADLYQREMGSLLNATPRWVPAAIFYLSYPAGLVYLIDAIHAQPLRRAALRGAIVGLMAYGAYNLTNLSVLRGWPEILSAVDMAWGMFLSATAAAGASWVVNKFATRTG